MDGFVVINTHVSAGNRREKQLARLVRAAEPHERVAVLGDFNAEHAVLMDLLAELSTAHGMGAFAITDSSGQLASRTGEPPKVGHTIDHVIVKTPSKVEAGTVIDVEGLSDHNPVTARVQR